MRRWPSSVSRLTRSTPSTPRPWRPCSQTTWSGTRLAAPSQSGQGRPRRRFSDAMPNWEITTDVHDVLANDEHAIALVTAIAKMDGKSFTYRTAEIYHVQDGKVTARWAFSNDTARINEFFAGTLTVSRRGAAGRPAGRPLPRRGPMHPAPRRARERRAVGSTASRPRPRPMRQRPAAVSASAMLDHVAVRLPAFGNVQIAGGGLVEAAVSLGQDRVPGRHDDLRAPR